MNLDSYGKTNRCLWVEDCRLNLCMEALFPKKEALKNERGR